MTSEKKEKPTSRNVSVDRKQSDTPTVDLTRISESIKGITLPTVGSHLTNPFPAQTQPPGHGSQMTSSEAGTTPQTPQSSEPAQGNPSDSQPKKTKNK